MENIHFINVVKSFFLGLFIGVILQFTGHSDVSQSNAILVVLASGSIGFIVGLLTEWLTSILPISMAKARTYFFINNLIALVVTTLIMACSMMITDVSLEKAKELFWILWIVLSIICAANLFDYFMYRRAQHKLKTFKALMKDK
ncbi:hypothetical protein [Paenibacillus agilis]|uniref:DUF3021 domain-containing protein n=1 Tax=Paenibacillus agilis TaxID=3020863 RepID=A0A559IQ38_9BACL|nr:hypothetical protein [Paenibacillus agilis]TVX89757.1 hypothetical protein FPZ44_18570 [Paenibacillus agilis]